MENKKLIRFVQSLIILPIVTVSIPGGNLVNMPSLTSESVASPVVLSKKINTTAGGFLAFNQSIEDQNASDLEEQYAQSLELRAEAIDTYFRERKMPLEGMGMKMIEEAIKNDLDWRLLPAVSVIETTGGKHLCKNPKAGFNPFGWGSCKIGFKSFDHAIETVAKNLGGNNPRTERYYKGKNTAEILRAYNPPSIVPDYNAKVFKVMNTIGDQDFAEMPKPLALGV